MAAGLLRLAAGGSIIVSSAGSEPAEALNPAVVAAMEEIGVDITDRAPTKLTDDMIQAVDVVVTMGCGDACPVYRGEALPRLGGRRPRRPAARSRPSDPRRHRRPGEPARRRVARRSRLSRWVMPCPRDRFLGFPTEIGRRGRSGSARRLRRSASRPPWSSDPTTAITRRQRPAAGRRVESPVSRRLRPRMTSSSLLCVNWVRDGREVPLQPADAALADTLLLLAVHEGEEQGAEGDHQSQHELTLLLRAGDDQRDRADKEGEAPDRGQAPVQLVEPGGLPHPLGRLLTCVGLRERLSDERWNRRRSG